VNLHHYYYPTFPIFFNYIVGKIIINIFYHRPNNNSINFAKIEVDARYFFPVINNLFSLTIAIC
jgi:hypothetical protein